MGSLAPGDMLPSVRELAAAAGVSPPTAAAALRSLGQRGLIVTRERRRSFVSRRPPVTISNVPFPAPSGARDLASGHPDPELLPDLTAALARVDAGRRTYDGEPVIAEVAALARAEFAEAGVRAQEICLANGALDGVERVLGAYLRPGDRVAVEDPGYSALLDLIRAMGLEAIPVAVDERGMQPASLAHVTGAGVEAVILTPRAHNPTGAALDEARAAELSLVLDYHRQTLVVEDDHQGSLAGVPGVSTVSGHERWAVIRSVAKALGPDIRLAFITGDPTTVSRVDGRLAVGPGWVSEILQRLVVELMGTRSVRTLLARAGRVYTTRREALLEGLASAGVIASGRSGFNVWIPVRDEAAVIAGLLQRGWGVAPGAPFRLRAAPAVRVTTSTLEVQEVEAFSRDIRAVLVPTRRRAA